MKHPPPFRKKRLIRFWKDATLSDPPKQVQEKPRHLPFPASIAWENTELAVPLLLHRPANLPFKLKKILTNMENSSIYEWHSFTEA